MARISVVAQTYYSTISRIDDDTSNSSVIVKRFHNKDDPRTSDRFQHEVRSLTRMGYHPHITQLLTSSPSTLTITLTMAPGSVLSSYTPAALKPYISTLCLQLALALSHIHSLDFIHDDFKPANIMFHVTSNPPACHATLVDFGACIETGTFTPSGTPWYMAPEFIRRFKCPRTDVWALGVTMAWAVGELGDALPEDTGDEWILPEIWKDADERGKMDRWLGFMAAASERLLERGEDGVNSVVASMLVPEYESRIESSEIVERLEGQR